MTHQSGPRSRVDLVVATCLAVALFVAAGSAAVAFTQGRPAGSFDAWIQPRTGGVLATAPLAIDRLADDDPVRLGWHAFANANGGAWTIYVDERTGLPTLASGPGIEWFAPGDGAARTLTDVESRARRFLGNTVALLGDWTPWLALDEAASGEVRDGSWRVVFRQEVDGVRVEGARLEFLVSRGRMTMFGTHAWAIPTVDGKPRLDAADAREVLDSYLGVTTAAFEPASEPELIVLAVDAAAPTERPRAWTGPRGRGVAHALAWRISFHDPDGPALWIGEVDAHDGSLLAFYDGAHYASIRGGVFPISPDGDCANGGCEIDGFPMPFVDYTESGQVETFTDTYGNVSCVDPAASFATNLVGTHVRVVDECGAIAEVGDCAAGAELGLKTGENCDIAPGTSAGNTAAARSGFYQVNRVAEIARFYNPGNGWLNGQVQLNVNVNATCNASWGGAINMYRAGNGCGNTAEIQGVVTHEWGHGYDQNDGGGYDNTSEGYADVVAIFTSRESCVGRGFFDSGTCSGYGDSCLTCTGIRDMDWAARQANTPATPTGFVQNNCPGGGGPCGYETHCESYPVSEAIYDLATRDLPAAGMDPATAWQTAERLWFGSRAGSGGAIYTCALPSSDSCAAGTWYQQMRAADDDDGNLANGTPNAAAIYAAFARHDIACGLPEDPENQSTSACPALATPALTVSETEAGTTLTWTAVAGAAEYLVLRGELGCDRQQVPVATVPGTETAWVDDVSDPDLPRRYRVQAIAANDACRGAVSNCAVAPDGPRLQRNGSRLIEDAVNGNANGFPDPGETLRMPTTLFNAGVQEALGVGGRLRVVDPALGRVIGNDATWPDLPVGAEAESADPHFELTLFDAATCGGSVDLEIDMSATGAATRSTRFRLPLGNVQRDFVQANSTSIPNNSTVNSTLQVDQDRTLTELDVSIDINQFQISELIVELISPAGTTVRLHDQGSGFGGIDARYDLERDPAGPGTMVDFEGESSLGTWTLRVRDVGGSFGSGTIVSWTLHATVAEPFDCEPFACPEPKPAQSPGGLTVDKTVDGGTGRVDLEFGWSGVAGSAGYHVLQSDGPTFAGTVDLTGRTTGATTLTAVDGAATTPAVTFFQVRAINGCNEESP